MINFGQYAIIDGVTHNFEKEPSWWWKIKPVTAEMELSMSKFMNSSERRAPIEIAFREIALTFGGTNIPADPAKPVEEGGEAVLKVGMVTEEIEGVIGLMPPDMLMEIWGAVGKSYPYWGPVVPNVK